MPKKKKQTQRTSSSALSHEEQLLLTRLLDELRTNDPSTLLDRIPGPHFAEALVEALPLNEPRIADLLSGIGEAFPDKTVQKALRKTAFRLKQRGISVPKSQPAEASRFAAAKEEASAYVGPIDGGGNRPLLLLLPQGASGVDLAMGAVNSEEGIIEFIYGRYGRKRMKEVKDLFFSKVPYMVETTLSHAATVLEHAYRKEEGKPSPAAAEYLRLRPWLRQNVDLLDRPAVADFIPLDSVTADMLSPTQVERLLQHELMLSWAIHPEKLRPLLDELAKAEQSPIFISEGQRREHLGKIKEDGIAKLLGEQDRMTFRSRLEEMGFLFFKIGEETLARLCVAAAVSLEERAPLLKVNPFLNALVDRSLGQTRKAARSSSLILP